MSGNFFGLVVESLVSILLAITIVYCVIVNRKLNALREDQAKLKEVVQALDRSTRNAENVIGELRETAAFTQEELDERIEYGRSTLNRLTAVVGEADAIMSKMGAMKQLTHQGEDVSVHGAQAAPAPGKSAKRPPAAKPAVKTEMRLSNLMRGEAARPSTPRPGNEPGRDKRTLG